MFQVPIQLRRLVPPDQPLTSMHDLVESFRSTSKLLCSYNCLAYSMTHISKLVRLMKHRGLSPFVQCSLIIKDLTSSLEYQQLIPYKLKRECRKHEEWTNKYLISCNAPQSNNLLLILLKNTLVIIFDRKSKVKNCIKVFLLIKDTERG